MKNDLNYTLIGIKLRAARLKKGFTQEYVSELAEISSQHCSGIECGKAKVSLPALVRLCNALETSPNEILVDLLTFETPQLASNISAVFGDCTPDEVFLMLSQAENLKKSLRLKNVFN